MNFTWTHVPRFKELAEKFPNVKYFAFDMDGTLIDSEVIHMQSIIKYLKEFHNTDIKLDESYKNFHGKTDTDCFQLFQSLYESDFNSLEHFLNWKGNFCVSALKKLTKEELFKPEILTLLRDLNDNQMRVCLVTASEKSFMMKVLEKFDQGTFEFALCASDTVRSKPFPDPYIEACKKFGLSSTSELMVFEDSETGYTSARTAGTLVQKVEWFN